MIKIFATDITEITPEGSERLYASLPGWRREQLCRITNTKQKMLSAGAGFLLAPALGVFGINALSARVCIGEFGKPYLPEQTRDYDRVADDMKERIYALRQEAQ